MISWQRLQVYSINTVSPQLFSQILLWAPLEIYHDRDEYNFDFE